MGGGGFKKTGRTKRFQDVERDLPPRIRKEPKPGDNPLKRPYPPHRRDINVLDDLLRDVPREMPSELSNRDRRTATRPQGVLYFHTLDIQDIRLSKRDFVSGAPINVYVEYECQGTIKCSYPVYSHRIPKIRIDHYAHFSAEISEVRVDATNDFVIHVYAFQNPEKHWLVGSQLIHLYNFIRDIHGISSIDLRDDLSYYCGTVNYEFAWAYGAYGYGHSNQLRNTKIPVYDSICHSLFPRIAPATEDLIDNKFRVRVPKRLRMITLYNLMVRVPLMDEEERQRAREQKKRASAGAERMLRRPSVKEDKLPDDKPKKLGPDFNREAKTLIFRRVRYARGRPVHVALNLDIHQKFMEPDFNQSYGEYICLRNRHDRLKYLTRMTEGRLRDRYEDEQATELFHPILDAEDCRTILSTNVPLACPPGYLNHKMHKCQVEFHSKVHHKEEDDAFVAGITSAPRFSGYLAQVFGYADPPDLTKKPVEDVEYKVKPNAFLGGGASLTAGMTRWERIKFKTRMWWYGWVVGFKNFWEYIFPTFALAMETRLPEISVTLPSPADSTTEFYCHSVQEKIYPKVPDFSEAKMKAINLVKLSRKKQDSDERDSDEEGDEKWDIKKEWDDLLKEQEKRKVSLSRMGRTGKEIRRMKDVRPMEHAHPVRLSQQRSRPRVSNLPGLEMNLNM